MTNPVVVEVVRGGRVESSHRGSGALVDADGRIAFAFGDVDRPVYPRSAVKALQALPLIESGAADRLGLTEREIALACASHSGEDQHVELAGAMVGKAAATKASSNAARTGRSAKRPRGRSPAPAEAPARCTTTAPASTRASSASPAPLGSSRRAMSRGITPFSARSRPRWRT